jgi:methyl-accepting chemotaxis protein
LYKTRPRGKDFSEQEENIRSAAEEQGADQINAAVSLVNEISVQNKENIDVLVKEVSKFKVE